MRITGKYVTTTTIGAEVRAYVPAPLVIQLEGSINLIFKAYYDRMIFSYHILHFCGKNIS
jgi:hypothetical protein